MDRIIAKLCYTQHQGSGFTFTMEDVLKMTPRRWRFFMEYLDASRSAEAEAIRQAYRTK